MYPTQTQIKQFKENGYLTIPGARAQGDDRSFPARDQSFAW